MLTRELLIRYQRQNPAKYEKKYGFKTPDEVLENIKPRPVAVEESPIKIEVKAAEHVETVFAPEPDAVIKEIVEQRIAKKRGANAK